MSPVVGESPGVCEAQAMKRLAWLTVMVGALGAPACVGPLALPEGAQLSCSDNGQCPPDAACAVAQQRCVVATGSCVVGGDVLPDGTGCQSAGVVVGVCHVGVCAESSCGDGVVATSEGCDDGADNSDVDADACRTDCTLARCGDGVTDSGEACDGDVGLGGSCAQCQRLSCRPDTANCNLDGTDGCECAPVGLFDGDALTFTIDDGHGLVVSVVDDGAIALEEVDLETGSRSVLTVCPRPTERIEVFDLVIIDGARFVVINGVVYRIDDGVLAVIRTPRDDSDKVFRLVAHGGFLVARTGGAIVRLRPDGSAEQALSPTASSGPDDELERTALTVTDDGDVAWLHRSGLRRIRLDGTEATPREHGTPVRLNGSGFLSAVGADVLAWDTSQAEGAQVLLRFSATAAVEITRVDNDPRPGSVLGSINLFVGPIAVDGTAVFASIINNEVPALSRVIVVDLAGGPARMVGANGTTNALAAARGRLLYREGPRLRLLTVAP
jgi:hypothetical protein